MSSHKQNRSLLSHALSFSRGRIPGQLIIQLTDSCNASCPQCGMRRNAPFRRSLLPLDECRTIIDHAASSGISALSFTGGEPFLYRNELLSLIRHAGEAGIRYLRTGTNGFLFMDHVRPDYESNIAKLAEDLAETGLYTFWISIDSSVPEVHERMRGLPGVIRGIEKALPIFHDHGIYPSANLGITRNILAAPGVDGNRQPIHDESLHNGFRSFFSRVIGMGFTIVNACYPMSIGDDDESQLNAVYGATADDDLVHFSTRERIALFRALRETIPEFRSRIRIFSPLSSLRALERQHTGNGEFTRTCRGGVDFFFIDAASGNTYPCGYRGNDNLGKFQDLDLSKPPLPPSCRECDWECFRDPSELLGPFHELFTEPLRLMKKLRSDREHAKLWLNDLRYYLACDLFNGRTAPNYRKMAAFGPTP